MSEPTHHKPDGCIECPLYKKGRGFVLGQGDARTAKYAIILEAPGNQELPLVIRPQAGRGFLETQQECDKELATRRRDYPDMEERFIKQGLPVAGPTGFALFGWVCKKIGILRSECYIDNTIRCLAPKGKDGAAYPKGEDRKAAESYCRQYDRLHLFRPDTAVVTIHPASLLRGEITMLPLLVKDFEKTRDFTAQGRRVLTLLGGKAAHAFLGYAQNVTRWRGDYTLLDLNWYSNVISRLNNAIRRPKKAKKTTKKVLSEESGAVEGSTTGVQPDSSIDAPTKKTRKRKSKKIPTEIEGITSTQGKTDESNTNNPSLPKS